MFFFSQCSFFSNSFVLHLVPRSTDHVKSIQQPAISWTICYFYSRSPVEMLFSIKSSFSWLVTLLVHTGANPGAVTLQPPKPPSALCPTLAFDQTVNKSFRIGRDFLGAGHTAAYLVIAWSPLWWLVSQVPSHYLHLDLGRFLSAEIKHSHLPQNWQCCLCTALKWGYQVDIVCLRAAKANLLQGQGKDHAGIPTVPPEKPLLTRSSGGTERCWLGIVFLATCEQTWNQNDEAG